MADDGLSTKEYLALVLLLAGGLLCAILVVGWAYQQRGILAPETTTHDEP